MKSATPEDTFDHTIGAGALSFEWWHGVTPVVTANGAGVPGNWEYLITADNGMDGETTATLNHAAVMKAARKIANDKGDIKYLSESAKRECRNLIFNADEADLDACISDELLQFIVLGEIVFG